MVSPGFTQAQSGPFGSYVYEDEKITLLLSAPNHYTLFGMEYSKRSGTVSSKEISRGTFSVKQEQLILEEFPSRSKMVLHIEFPYQLQAVKLKAIEEGELLHAWEMSYANGETRMEGGWKKGKKHGTWIYFDEEGNVTKSEKYRRGKLLD